MKLMDELELSATPAIFYLDDKGGLQQQQGAPSPEKLVKILEGTIMPLPIKRMPARAGIL